MVTDGHAGNVRQARALADALKLRPRDLVLAPRAPWRWFAPRRVAGARRAFGGDFERLLASPGLRGSLVIGCGRQAALATRLLRLRGATAVQVLDPRIDPRHWDAVVAPAHDRLHGPNVLTLTGSLNPVNDAWLGAARAAFSELGRMRGPRTALLVGGPTAQVKFDVRRFGRWMDAVRTVVEREGGSVLLTTSRRTPEAFVERARRAFKGLPGLVWTGSVDGRNPYAGLLGWADRIVCTADSVNMLSEACATRAPAFVFGATDARGRAGSFVRALLDSGRLRRPDIMLEPFDVEPLRETERIAQALRQRLGLDRTRG